MCSILILADIRPMGYKLPCCGSIGLGKNILFKSILGRCGVFVCVVVQKVY